MSATRTLVLGGIRSGKTAQAEALAGRFPGPVVYLATATADDEEMARRVARHQASRPAAWGLVEEPVMLAAVLEDHAREARPPLLLIDCMSLWVSNLLFAGDDVFRRQRTDFLGALVRYPGQVVIVSNEVGLGTIGMDALTRRFCDELGWLNQELSARCDTVIMSVAGLAMTLKE